MAEKKIKKISKNTSQKIRRTTSSKMSKVKAKPIHVNRIMENVEEASNGNKDKKNKKKWFSKKTTHQKAVKEIIKNTKEPWYKKEISLSFGKVRTVEIVMMTKHMSVMLSAGLTIPETLTVVSEQAKGVLKNVLKRVSRRVNQGESFGDSISMEPKVFSPIFISSVHIGENSGTLAENLERLALQMEKSLIIKRSIQSAMLYPMVVISMTLILGFGIATFVLPQIAGIFRSLRVDLPWTTRILLKISVAFEQNGILISLGSIFGIIFIIWFLKRKFLRPIVDLAVLNVPFFGSFIHDINRARFTRTLGTLLDSGTPISESLQITYESSTNFIYRHSIKRMLKRVDGGENFTDAIFSYPHLYPSIIRQMISVGEQSGSLAGSLNYLADFYEGRVEVAAKNISSLIEPILLVAVGLMVGLLAVSILTPIYSILGSVSI